MKLKEAKKEDQYTMESIPPDWDSMFLPLHLLPPLVLVPSLLISLFFGENPVKEAGLLPFFCFHAGWLRGLRNEPPLHEVCYV